MALVMMLGGIVGYLVYGDDSTYSEMKFICFGFVIFVACNALEAPTMVSIGYAVNVSMM